MHLTTQDADLFFELTWSLQFFVNQQIKKFPDIQTVKEYKNTLASEDKGIIKDTLYTSPHFFDDYIAKNPDNFNQEKLEVIRAWKQFVQGKFQIERFLKKHAIFIHENNSVYAVVGLYDGFDEMIHKSHLPTLVEATLLPFKGKLVYDGLLRSYNIHFGRNTKAELKEDYMRAKQNGRIIDSFDKKSKTTQQAITTTHYSKEIKDLLRISKKLRGGASQPLLNSPVFSLVKAATELADQAVIKQANINDIYQTIRKLDRARNKLITILDRME